MSREEGDAAVQRERYDRGGSGGGERHAGESKLDNQAIWDYGMLLLDKLVARGFGKDRIFLSLERRMECGIGKCGHCAVGYTFTCLHGPVFSYWDAINLPELIYE